MRARAFYLLVALALLGTLASMLVVSSVIDPTTGAPASLRGKVVVIGDQVYAHPELMSAADWPTAMQFARQVQTSAHYDSMDRWSLVQRGGHPTASFRHTTGGVVQYPSVQLKFPSLGLGQPLRELASAFGTLWSDIVHWANPFNWLTENASAVMVSAGSVNTASSNASTTTLTVTVSYNNTDFILIAISKDETSTCTVDTGVSSEVTAIDDSAPSNNFLKIGEWVNCDTAAAADGQISSLWYTYVTVAKSAATMTITFSAATVAKAVTIWRYTTTGTGVKINPATSCTGGTLITTGTPGSCGISADASTTAGSTAPVFAATTHDTEIRAVGQEDNVTTMTPTAGFTAFVNAVGAGVGVAGSEAKAEFRIVTGAPITTYPTASNPTVGAGLAASAIASVAGDNIECNGTNRFWIPGPTTGTGNWSDIRHWSDVTNGVGGCSVPATISEGSVFANVKFDANSCTAACTITVDVPEAYMLSFDDTGFNDASSSIVLGNNNWYNGGNQTHSTANLPFTCTGGNSIDFSIYIVGNLTLSGGSINCGSSVKNVRILGNVSISAAASFIDFGAGTWGVGGSWTNSSTSASWDPGTGQVNFAGTTSQTMTFCSTCSAISEFNSVRFIPGAAVTYTMATNGLRWRTVTGTLTLETNATLVTSGLALTGGSLVVNDGGVLTASTSTVTVFNVLMNQAVSGTITLTSGAWTVSGNWDTTGAGSTFTKGTSTVTMSGPNKTIAILNAANNFNNLTISAAGTVTQVGLVDVGGTLTVNSGAILASEIQNLTVATLGASMAGGITADDDVNSTGGTKTINSASVTIAATGFFQFGSSLGWTFATSTWTNSSTSASWKANTGSVLFNSATGAAFTPMNQSINEFFNVTFTSSAATAQTFTLATRPLRWGGTLTVADVDNTNKTTLDSSAVGTGLLGGTVGSLTIGAGGAVTDNAQAMTMLNFTMTGATGTLTLTTAAVTAAGNWDSSGAGTVFTAGTSAVTMSGVNVTVKILNASNAFYDYIVSGSVSEAGNIVATHNVTTNAARASDAALKAALILNGFTLQFNNVLTLNGFLVGASNVSATGLTITNGAGGTYTITALTIWNPNFPQVEYKWSSASTGANPVTVSIATTAANGTRWVRTLDGGAEVAGTTSSGTITYSRTTGGTVEDVKMGMIQIIVTTTEAPGVNCANGGQKLTYGADTNINNVLDASEITTTVYICNGTNGTNGTNGADGFNSLVSVTTAVEPPGANCTNGGTKITFKSGLDNGDGGGVARNGILEAGEVDNTTIYYSCKGDTGATGANGADGFNSLVDVTTATEPPGANCTNGGTKITVKSGLDNGDGGGVARDGVLQAGEVDQTTIYYSCKGDTGATGATGANGFDTLVNVTTATEPPGANCTYGGTKITIKEGLDNGDGGGVARNGILEAGEVDQTTVYYSCTGAPGTNGTNGADGFNSLVDVSTAVEAPGANCTNGGTKVTVKSGLDNGDGGGVARNGVLEAGEVDQTTVYYSCKGNTGATGANGADGFNSLVSVTTAPESPGVNCANGGTKITFKSGLDNGDGGGTARNGILEAGEVDNTVIYYSCTGATGPTGSAGANGFNSLLNVTTVPEAPGANCANGGTKVTMQSGLDNGDGGGVARDGILQAGEVDQTTVFYSCNGADGTNGTNGHNGLVKLTTVFPVDGTNCSLTSNGETKVESGTDTNDNGTLDPGEVQFTEYICGGLTGSAGTNAYNSLVQETTEPPGPNCPDGGQKIESGLDDGSGGGIPNNGMLEPGEVDDTSYVCNGHNSLAKLTTIDPQDSNCPAESNGETKLEVGRDDNGNGTLDAGEVMFTKYICGGLVGAGGANGTSASTDPIREFALLYQDLFEFLTLASLILVIYGAVRRKTWMFVLGLISLSFVMFFLSLSF